MTTHTDTDKFYGFSILFSRHDDYYNNFYCYCECLSKFSRYQSWQVNQNYSHRHIIMITVYVIDPIDETMNIIITVIDHDNCFLLFYHYYRLITYVCAFLQCFGIGL